MKTMLDRLTGPGTPVIILGKSCWPPVQLPMPLSLQPSGTHCSVQFLVLPDVLGRMRYAFGELGNLMGRDDGTSRISSLAS